MKFKRLRHILLFLIAVSCSAYAQSIPAPSASPTRPPGIAASTWIPITDTLGFVITKDSPPLIVHDRDTGKQTTLPSVDVQSSVIGYFMFLRNGRWLRLETELPPARALDAH